jgi:hypothetical protein
MNVTLVNGLRGTARVALAAGIVGGAVVLTAGNAVPASRAGDGRAAVAGYTASNIVYNLDSADPQNIDSVTLTLNVAPVAGSTMTAQLADGGSWYSCSNSGTSLTCPTTSPQATAAAATELTVVIAD